MYLKALEIQGFKSFPDKTVLTFGEDITAIVGPNGSGKSNISDAIRWVMGEQSTRTLRGGKMEDVIFGGTAQRRQTGYAEVSLVLDNTAHLFDMDESEIMVTRRYYRSGESEYYINRRSVRLRDINELFMDTGLGREGYSLIGQGRIDEILSVKSSDRREIFEEAAGISRFRHRKEEAERKLERTDDNLLRINDKISELELQVEPLRGQSEKAKKFLVLRDELRGLEISVWLDTLERIRAGNIKLETDYKEAVRQKEAAERAVEERFGAAEQLSQQMRDKEVQADQLRFAIQSRDASIRELDSAVAVLRSNIQHNLENTARIREELEQREGRQDSLDSQIAERRARLAEVEQSLEESRRQVEEKNAQAQQALRSAGTLARELEQLRDRESMKTADAHQAKAVLSALAAAAQEVLDRDQSLRRELASLEERLEYARQDVKQAQKKLNEALEERDGVKNVISGYALRLESRRKKAEQARERIAELEGEAEALKSEAQGKAQGQSDLQERSLRITQELSQLNAALAALEAERETGAATLKELEGLRQDLAGDQDQSRALIGDYEEKNQAYALEIQEKEARLAQLRQENQGENETIARLNQEKLALEGERVKATREGQEKNKELLTIGGEVSRLEQKKMAASLDEKQLLDKLWETYELSHEAARQQRVEIESVPKASRRIAELKKGISALGNVNIGAIEEFERVNERYTYLTDQRDDVEKAKKELQDVIAQITGEMKTIFAREFTSINEAFGQTFAELFGGGKATLELEDPNDILNCGIEIKVQPPGKALKVITLLSGGEKAFVAIALYFAILKVRPTPFVVMDEIEAALDDNNVTRFARYMRSMAEKTQFIVITHRRGTMEEADVLYGVTMQEQGVSRILTINLNDVEKELNIR